MCAWPAVTSGDPVTVPGNEPSLPSPRKNYAQPCTAHWCLQNGDEGASTLASGERAVPLRAVSSIVLDSDSSYVQSCDLLGSAEPDPR